jgi:DNA polymerase-1
MKLVFDIEADNLLPKISKFHCAGAMDVDTGAEYWFRPHQLKEFLALLDKADTIIAHNAYGYDIAALYKLTGWTPKATVQCTKVMSQVLNYRRFGFGHSLKAWGESLGDNKGDYSGGFESFNEDMFEYMKQDVRLNVKVYKSLMRELKQYISNTGSKDILRALRSEMTMDSVMAEQCENGWKFNRQDAVALKDSIEEKMAVMVSFINPLLPGKANVVDPDTTKEHEAITGKRYAIPKKPTYKKTGQLYGHICSWFELDLDTTVDTCPVWGEYCRVTFDTGDIGNTDTVKQYLGSIGWKPDAWNWKRINGQFIKVSAKLSDSSLEGLGDVGKALMEYYTLRSRKSILEGWFEHVDKNSRLHGDVFNIGTPTFRQTHKIIANLPSGKAVLGPEFRKLFITEKGYKLVSADSAACQLRLLAHFMKDDGFTKEVLEGDIHQKNADILGCSRATAKPFIFAFLYGAGGKKLGTILNVSDSEGNRAKAKFLKAIPPLKALISKVQKIVDLQGYLPGLDDRPIHVESAHKALNYLIQGAEAVVMKYTVNMIHSELAKAKIDSRILLFYHDEVTYEVKEDQAEKAKSIIMRCFEEAPKELGVDIMTCGDCKIGEDYYDVH